MGTMFCGRHPRIIEPYGGLIGPKLRSSCPPGDDAQALQVVAVRHLAPRAQGEMVPGLSATRRLFVIGVVGNCQNRHRRPDYLEADVWGALRELVP